MSLITPGDEVICFIHRQQQAALAPLPPNNLKRVVHLEHLELTTSSLWTNEIVLG